MGLILSNIFSFDVFGSLDTSGRDSVGSRGFLALDTDVFGVYSLVEAFVLICARVGSEGVMHLEPPSNGETCLGTIADSTLWLLAKSSSASDWDLLITSHVKAPARRAIHIMPMA